MKALKAFIKPIEAPQRGAEKKLTFISIQFSEMHGEGRFKRKCFYNCSRCLVGIFIFILIANLKIAILLFQTTVLPLITAYEIVSLRDCRQILLLLLSESANFNDPENLRFSQVFWGINYQFA